MYFQAKNTLTSNRYYNVKHYQSMVNVSFQSIFFLQIYQNNILKKIIFEISISKRYKNNKKILI